MKCPLCSRDITEADKLIGPFKLFQPNIQGDHKGGEILVCGSCFLLTSINDTLMSILEELRHGRPRRPGL